ncbi:MAG: BBP7 family outer membrane beta-barrel protein [Planctomycetota bacterium]|nr:BBP7 family outer membrane beta-barrel protein [Planctomycetota bacterium]
MTPARCVALAMVFGACWLGATSAQAQYPAPAGPGAYPGPMVVDGPPMSPGDPGFSPYRTPQPMQGVPSAWDIEVPDDGTLLPHPAIFSGSGFARVEYLNYNFSGPGDVLLGAPVAGNPDPSQKFIIFAPGTDVPNYYGQVPDLLSTDLRDVSGIRTTLGFEFANGGTVEVSAFMTGQRKSTTIHENFGSSDVNFNGITITLPNAYATSVLANGQASDLFYVYNQRFESIYQSQLWGADLNFLPDYDVDGLFHFRPIFGAKFLNLHERLSQYGIFQELAPVPAFQSSIISTVQNYLGGGQAGVRAELVTRFFDLGAEGKFLVMSNTMSGTVQTANFRFDGDPQVTTTDNTTQMSLGFDLIGWGVLHVHPSVDLRIGYNFIYLTNVTRPAGNIYYNETGIDNPAGVVMKMAKEDFIANGVSLGADFKW